MVMKTTLRDHNARSLRDKRWPVAEAKARFSHVVESARAHPQVIENRGEPVAVVLSIEEYERLRGAWEDQQPTQRWQRFLRLSETIRKAGGATIDTGPRGARKSPFDVG